MALSLLAKAYLRPTIMARDDDTVGELVRLLSNANVTKGLVDESDHQRCALRCFSQCLVPSRAVNTHECMHECYMRCLTENPRGDVAVDAATVAWRAMMLFVVAALVIALSMPMRVRLRTLVTRFVGKRSQ